MTTKAEVKIQPGDFVNYVDSKGLRKTALVTATPETVEPGHRVPELEPNEIHCLVFSPLSGAYVKMNVLRADEPLAGSGSWSPRTT